MKLRIITGAVIALCFVAGTSVRAAEHKVGGAGNVNGFVQLFSEDILYLEREISKLIAECGRELN